MLYLFLANFHRKLGDWLKHYKLCQELRKNLPINKASIDKFSYTLTKIINTNANHIIDNIKKELKAQDRQQINQLLNELESNAGNHNKYINKLRDSIDLDDNTRISDLFNKIQELVISDKSK